MFKIKDNKIGNNDNCDIGDNKNNKFKKSEKTTNKNNWPWEIFFYIKI